MSAQPMLRCGAYSPLTMAMTCAPDEADRREPIMMTPDMMFEGVRLGGKTNLMLERLKSADELNDAEWRMALRSNKGPTEIVRDLQTILITKPPGRQTEVMSQWEYDIRHPPQSKPRSKRGQRGRRWR